MATTPEAPVATRSKYEPVIGLEVHVQLLTKTKIFCGCSTRFGDPPNTNVCPVCLGLPGALPVLNRQAVEFAVLAAMALNCRINETSIFARKNYFYPDLPKGYQISQYDKPLAEHGYIDDQDARAAPKRIGITRVHMEEDAGKSLHDGLPDCSEWTSIDLNRSRHAADRDRQRARHRLARRSLRVPDAAEGDHPLHRRERLQHGRGLAALRRQRQHSPARPEASSAPRPRSRTSTRSASFAQALEYEIERQSEVLESGGRITQETRLYNAAEGKTYGMRSQGAGARLPLLPGARPAAAGRR